MPAAADKHGETLAAARRNKKGSPIEEPKKKTYGAAGEETNFRAENAMRANLCNSAIR